METFDQNLPPMDPTKAKLRYKLSYYGLTDGVTKYEEECVDMITENLYVYMKSVLRQMVKYKRTYEIVSPVFMKEEESKEKTDESKKKLKPWETPFDDRKVTPEFKKKIEENDLKEAKEIALMKSQTDIDYVASLNIDRSKDFKKNDKNKKEATDKSSEKMIEIPKNSHDKPKKKEVHARGKEETNVSQEGKFLQHNKQSGSKEVNKQDESMDIVDVSEDEQSVSQVDDNVKYKNKKFKSSHPKNLGMGSEKYDSSKMHEVEKVCIKCGKKFEAKFCDRCKKPTELSVKENLKKVGKESAETKKQSKKRSDLKAECQKLKDCLQILIKYEPISVARYPSKIFDIKDMMQLFRGNPFIVPLRSIYQITMMRIANKQPSESSDFNFQSV